MQTTSESSTPTPPAATFGLTESAAARINALKAMENNPGLRFRVAVKGGGCSGFQYDFSLDGAEPAPQDTIIARDGAEAVIDDVSLGILAGAVLDYSEDLSRAGFEIKNPNATAKCGCGNSFSVSL
jgi:iron-sulfur cluster insertion protein